MRCLLVGDGDLSFSLSVAKKWEEEHRQGKRGKWKLVATCFDTQEELCTKYRHAEAILAELGEVRQRVAAVGCSLEALAAVDATCIAETLKKARAHPQCQLLNGYGTSEPTRLGNYGDELAEEREKFERIVFQFPHRGGKNFMGKNRELLLNFFRSASGLLSRDRCHAMGALNAQVVVTLLVGQGGTDFEKLSIGASHVPESRRLTKRVHGDHWQVTEIAAESGLILTPDTAFFDARDFPDYRPRGYRNTLDNAAKGFTLDYSVSHVLVPCFGLPNDHELLLAKEQETYWSTASNRVATSLMIAVSGIVGFEGDSVREEAPSFTLRAMRPSQRVNRTRVPMAVPTGMKVSGVDTRFHTVELLVSGTCDSVPTVPVAVAAIEPWLSSFLSGSDVSGSPRGMEDVEEGKVVCDLLTFLSLVPEEEEEAVMATTLTREGTLLDDVAIDTLPQEECLVLVASSQHQFPCGVTLEMQLPVGSVHRFDNESSDNSVLFVSLSIEAFVMTVLGIPTLQHFWTLDPRVTCQVSAALQSLGAADQQPLEFQPVSILQHTLERQICFWLPSDHASPSSTWNVEDFNTFLQQHYQGNLVRLCLKSDYERSPSQRSHNYRLTFWSPYSALAGTEITRLTNELYSLLPERFGVTMR